MTFGHTGEAHWAEFNTASALGSLTAPAPKVKVKGKGKGMVDQVVEPSMSLYSACVFLA